MNNEEFIYFLDCLEAQLRLLDEPKLVIYETVEVINDRKCILKDEVTVSEEVIYNGFDQEENEVSCERI